jgi:hypothetical protein
MPESPVRPGQATENLFPAGNDLIKVNLNLQQEKTK